MFLNKKYLVTYAVTKPDGTLLFVNEVITGSKLTAGNLQGRIKAMSNRYSGDQTAITFIKELEG